MRQCHHRACGPNVVGFIIVLFTFGCGGAAGPKVIPVSGTITRGGKPVANVLVNFMPVQGRPSWAITDDNGHFTLEYDDTQKGAVAGNHKVWITPPISASEGLGPQDQPKTNPELPAILEKYGSQESSPLKVSITAESRVIDLKLD